MKFESPMLVVADINKSVQFYKDLFGLDVVLDFGANKTLTGWLVLQTLETYREFIGVFLFVLPLTVKVIYLSYGAAIVCATATFAAIQEGHYYPNFLALMEDGTYQLTEVKGDKMIDDAAAKAKA